MTGENCAMDAQDLDVIRVDQHTRLRRQQRKRSVNYELQSKKQENEWEECIKFSKVELKEMHAIEPMQSTHKFFSISKSSHQASMAAVMSRCLVPQ